MQEFLAPILLFYLSELGAAFLLLFKDTAGLSGRFCAALSVSLHQGICVRSSALPNVILNDFVVLGQ